MSSNLVKYKEDLEKLIKIGKDMNTDLTIRAIGRNETLDAELEKLKKMVNGLFEKQYQQWYTEAHAVILQIIPTRIGEFEELYFGNRKSKDINASTYGVQHWLNGVRSNIDRFTGEKFFDDFAAASMKFKTQFEILCSANSRFTSSLFDIRQILQADLFDSELDAARELLKNGFLRGAGAIAGVVLERHLGQVIKNHKVITKKKNLSISELNDLLKNNGVIDVPTWRNIQRLADLRNLCDHNNVVEPKKEDVSELIENTEKTIKTLF